MTSYRHDIVILGCGSSTGLPLIYGYRGLVDPRCPRNLRTRPGVAFHAYPWSPNGDSKKTFSQEDPRSQVWLIDASPDIRTQCLREKIHCIDGLLCTHSHFDHIGGIEDLKPFWYSPYRAVYGRRPTPLPLYADQATIERLYARCPYAFGLDENGAVRGVPFLQAHLLPDPTLNLGGVPVQSFVQQHGKNQSLGFRLGPWAYSTDASFLDEQAFQVLKGVDLWIVDCLGYTQKSGGTHSYVKRTLEWIQRVQPRQAILTHLGHEIDYLSLSKALPPGVEVAFDGMRFQVDVPLP
jgi:phosphoribosyl 1,2-cyclic phosphate phosphodiesterase